MLALAPELLRDSIISLSRFRGQTDGAPHTEGAGALVQALNAWSAQAWPKAPPQPLVPLDRAGNEQQRQQLVWGHGVKRGAPSTP